MITVNGDEVEWEEGLTVSRLLRRLNFRFPLIVVRIDGKLIRRENYDTLIPDDAKVDAIHLTGGG